MVEAEQPVSEPKKTLSKEERSTIAREAARLRWANSRQAKAAAEKEKAARRAKPKVKTPAAPREFSSALKVAEKRLAAAIQERAEAASRYAIANAEIPSLARLIAALRNPGAMIPEQAAFSTPMTLEQIVGDQPLAYSNPPRLPSAPMPQAPGPATLVIPTELHPANRNNRAQGGAIGVNLEAGQEDEDQFLRDSKVAGGEWH